MGYLDYAGLQYLWGKLKEKFAPKSHSHDDRYYTETEMDGKLNSKVNNNEEGANGLINKLSTADGIPNDATVFISQHNDGKTASYYRRPISTLWTYIKSKTDSVYQPKGNYAASGHTHDDRYYTEAEVNSKLEAKASSDHTHGLNSSSLTKSVDNTTTNSWDMVGGNKDFLLRSLRMQAKAPDWLEDNYAAGIAFGGADTKGVISHAYNAPDIKFAGGNGAAPVWWLRLTGTSGKTYNLNAMPPASHTHTKDQVGLGNVDNTADANKSVKYATSAGNASKVNNHTVNIDVPANAKFTDTTYGVATASSNGLMSSTDKTKLDDFSRVISIQKQIKLTTDWQDTGIAGNNLETGTYIIQVSGFNSSYTQIYSEMYSGIMTWCASETNDLNNDEIFLHNAGHASNSNDIYLRTSRRLYSNGGLHLQIACKVAASGTDTLTFKFRRLI